MLQLTGTLLAGRYRVGRRIGGGGMGEVYEAVHETLQRRFAIKVVYSHLAHEPDVLERFRREALAVGALEHPNIVQIFDYQNNPGEPPFLVMEYLPGASLRAVIKESAPLDPRRVARIAAHVLSALSTAHTAGFVHRDIKPDNVFLCPSEVSGDVVKLLDFGIAKVLDSEVEGGLTQTGALLGTLAYSAPEQARGERVDARADIYSVGACMYHALAGRKPFDGPTTSALLHAVLNDPLVPIAALREIDAGLAALVERALDRDRDERFASAEEMLEALLPFAGIERAVMVIRTEAPVGSRATTVRDAGESATHDGHTVTPSVVLGKTLLSPGTKAPTRRRWMLPALTLVALAAVAAAQFSRGQAAPMTATLPIPVVVVTDRTQETQAPDDPELPMPLPSPSAELQRALSVASARVAEGDAPPATAAQLSNRIANAYHARDGKGCLAAFRELDAADPKTSKLLAGTRAMCTMLAGDCSGGKALWQDVPKGMAPVSKASMRRHAEGLAATHCPEGQLSPREQIYKRRDFMHAAIQDKQADKIVAEANRIIAILPKLTNSEQDKSARIDGNSLLDHAARALAKLGRCEEARRFARTYVAGREDGSDRDVERILYGSPCASAAKPAPTPSAAPHSDEVEW